jgi:hypothetical protein
MPLTARRAVCGRCCADSPAWRAHFPVPDGLHLARFARARLRGLISEAPMAAMLAENGAWAWPILLACADARAPRRQALVPLARVPPLRLVTAAGTGMNAARRSRGPGRGPGVAGNPSAASAVSAMTRVIRAARAHAAPDRTCGKERVNGRSLISRCQRPGGLSYVRPGRAAHCRRGARRHRHVRRARAHHDQRQGPDDPAATIHRRHARPRAHRARTDADLPGTPRPARPDH